MFAGDFLKPPKPGPPEPKPPKPQPGIGREILKVAVIAGLSVVARDLAKWLVEEIREAAGRPAKKEKKKASDDETPTDSDPE